MEEVSGLQVVAAASFSAVEVVEVVEVVEMVEALQKTPRGKHKCSWGW